MTANKITGKITGYAVKNPELKTEAEVSATVTIKEILGMNPDWKRPETLPASVYKICKCPNSPEAAVYVTISNAVLDGMTVPVEIFINSQDVKHQQWTTALTRTISAMFRQGVDCSFIAEELIQTHDPKGGFLQKGLYHPSLVSQIGRIMKAHMEGLKAGTAVMVVEHPVGGNTDFPPTATLCTKCHHKAVIVSDGCSLCLNCSDSRCG